MKKVLEKYIEILSLAIWGILILQLLQAVLSCVEEMG
jgi:hypothetical protein